MSNADGKRKLVTEDDDEVVKARMRAEGWKFSSDQKRKELAEAEMGAPDEEEDLLQLVCASGGLAAPKLLACLESEITSVNALAAVAALAEQESGRKILLSKGAAEAVVKRMRDSSGDAAIAANGCAALANLALGETAAAVLDAQAVEATVEAMRRWPSDAKAQAKGCLALCNAAFSPAGEARVLEAAGVGAIVVALEASADASVAEECCDLIVSLAASEPGLAALRGNAWGSEGGKGLSALLASLKALLGKHPECTSVQECVDAVAAAAAGKQGD